MAERLVISVNEVLSNSRSSGRGVSFHREFHKCPFKLVMEGKVSADGRLADELPPEPTTAKPLQTSFHYFAGVGTLFHKMVELYRNGKWSEVEWLYEGEAANRIFSDAADLFAHYRSNFPHDELLVVACEEPFRFEHHPAFGFVPVFTGRYDLVHGIQPQHLESIQLRRGLMIGKPGVYLWDYKVKWRRMDNAADEWAASPQVNNYMAAWDQSHPENPCQGFVIDTIYCYTKKGKITPQLESFYIAPPTEEKKRAARNWLIQAENTRRMFGYPANTEECFRIGVSHKTCEHHPSAGGYCDLVGLPKHPELIP